MVSDVGIDRSLLMLVHCDGLCSAPTLGYGQLHLGSLRRIDYYYLERVHGQGSSPHDSRGNLFDHSHARCQDCTGRCKVGLYKSAILLNYQTVQYYAMRSITV